MGPVEFKEEEEHEQEHETEENKSEEEERAELEAELQRLQSETEEAEATASDMEEERELDSTGLDLKDDEDTELARGAQAEADAARERIQEVENDYGKGPQFDEQNIIEEYGEWAVTHQGISHLHYEIHIAADVLAHFSKAHVEARYPYTNADDFVSAQKAAVEYHFESENPTIEGGVNLRVVKGEEEVYNPNPDFEDDYEPNAFYADESE